MRQANGQNADANGQETLTGNVERIVSYNDENGHSVLQIKARGHHDIVKVVGYSATVTVGESINATGMWSEHPKYGPQFSASSIWISPPTSIEGIEKYLGSGTIEGIGRIYAKRLVKAFGDDVLDIIDSEPERLREVPGIGAGRAKRITESWNEKKSVHEIMVFLLSHGVGTARAITIFKTYGNNAVQVITENPYRLTHDIHGIGFKIADAIAVKLEVEKTATVRIRSGISHVLSEAMSDGHCGLQGPDLLLQAAELLGVSEDLVRGTIRELEREERSLDVWKRTIVIDTVDDVPCVFLGRLYQAEQLVARNFAALSKGHPPWSRIDTDKAIPWVETKIGMALDKTQVEAVAQALQSKVTVITGGPGVGKTTIVDAILRILTVKNVEVLLCAPTGRAAKRLSDATGLEAKTIHRLLEFDPRTRRFRRDRENPLECDLLVVDETSMVDVLLMMALLGAIPTAAALLIVGDVDQLPSVGPGQVLADIISSTTVPVIRLTEVFRQSAGSRIVTMAHGINRGVIPDLSRPTADSDFYFVRADSPELAAQRIVHLVKTRIPDRFDLDPVHDIQVLSPMNRGHCGAWSLNTALQTALNPASERRVERAGWTYAPDDKVMQIENDYDKDVFNGDIGFVIDVDPEAGELTANFDGRVVMYRFGELSALVPAYAVTIHKSQGSEYPAVVIPMLRQHYIMLQRNLLYTGVTRGKRLVILVGQQEAVRRAVDNVVGRRRISKLRDWLAQPDHRLN